MRPLLPSTPTTARGFTASMLMTAVLAACGGGSDAPAPTPPAPVPEATPVSLKLEKIGGYSTGQFGVSAAEIPAFDAASKRLFVVNAQLGAVDVLDLANPANPVKIGVIDATAVLAGAEINSVAVHNGIVAVAIQAPVKTDPGRMALYRASDLGLISSVTIGALPDMVTFTPDGHTVLVANEGEPSDDYQVDPEGSVSVIDVRNPAAPVVRTAGFTAFNGQEATLRAAGVRIYGPGATAAKDFEPEYIAVSADSKTAWVTLQENNAMAKVDIATATVTQVLPLGYKDHGVAGNELDASDTDGGTINIRTWPGVRGMYLPDAMASYTVGGATYLVTANEGDARAWGEDNAAYWGGDATQGFVEEFRVKHLVNKSGWAGRAGNDLPPQLNAMAAGALLDPATFGYCGAIAGDPLGCRADAALGRLNISWTMGYRTNPDGSPMMFSAAGVADPLGNRLMYDQLYSYGARSFSIWNANGGLVWDSGAEIEKFLASSDCKLGSARNIPCADFFNSGHDEGNAKDSRSDAKGPEPEGIALGQIGTKTFAFIGLERMGGVLVYDITNPTAPKRVDYLNTRDEWLTNPPSLATAGDLGPEGLAFIPAARSPNGKPLLVVGNEVSGTTAVMQLNLMY
ncbi:MAG: choice-of-anchor I family protein [Hydrogenophaga sp.]|uniref:choice-of-anchor I family protein n=1 Tax=Hydrogenophaga sp. TaxID=1904254 RepID=UPI00260ED7C8|nr:choice-of-anchor I family protein [Hydrogenophaga sp.]MCW5670961.1 choice-of-anchor I family protein [Hydrogenophaga sp.]